MPIEVSIFPNHTFFSQQFLLTHTPSIPIPSQVCADKLKNELDQFGYPPVLPGETEKEEEEAVQESPDPSDPTKKVP